MIVFVDSASARVELREPEVLNRFHVEVPGGDAGVAVRALGADGRAAEAADHVWVRIGALREWAQGRVDEGWGDGFEKMIAYAKSKGWVDDAGTHVQAHIQQP